jgi:hypothetical protein
MYVSDQLHSPGPFTSEETAPIGYVADSRSRRCGEGKKKSYCP